MTSVVFSTPSAPGVFTGEARVLDAKTEYVFVPLAVRPSRVSKCVFRAEREVPYP